uniref:ARAD1D51172p n=1 Tax=Blastobotrys adeninivorans TaxID=409370 RepID=A0A060TK00_BLAAD
MDTPVTISSAEPGDFEQVKELFQEYADSLPVSLDYQNFDNELGSFPGKYSDRLGGTIVVARDTLTDRIIGCVALRAISSSTCEIKRLYVKGEGRGLGIGKILLQSVIQKAKQIGYSKVYLDTLPSMQKAIDLYLNFGFTTVDPYYDSPVTGTVFMQLDLCGSK